MKLERDDILAISEGMLKLGLATHSELEFLSIRHHSSSLFTLYRIEPKANPDERAAVEVVRRLADQRFPLAAKVMDLPQMAESEGEAIKRLYEVGARAPRFQGTFNGAARSILFMDFVPPGRMDRDSLLTTLETLYSSRGEKWGWSRSNFIGTLPQRNRLHDSFASFWWSDRIEQQALLALKRGLVDQTIIKRLQRVVQRTTEEWRLERVTPRLIHGDLWSGNLLPGSDGVYLIDPSIAWSHPEQDLAMLDLFGGPLNDTQKAELLAAARLEEAVTASELRERRPFWQIYPLLVHVNIFGSSYLSQLKSAIASSPGG